MGSKNKLKRFRENEIFANVIQPTREEVVEGFPLCGKWSTHFKNNNPIILELGCGKGEYTVALARQNPNFNYIGIDIKGARFWRGAKTALEENLKNVLFLRNRVYSNAFQHFIPIFRSHPSSTRFSVLFCYIPDK